MLDFNCSYRSEGSDKSLDTLENKRLTHPPFTHPDLVCLPDSHIGAVIGLWNLGEACGIDVGDLRETWPADDLAPTD